MGCRANPNLFLSIFVVVLSNTTMPIKCIDYVKAHEKIIPFTSRLIARTLIESDRRFNVIRDSSENGIRRNIYVLKYQ